MVLLALGTVKAAHLWWIARILRKIADVLTDAAESSPSVKASVNEATKDDLIIKAQLDAILEAKGMGPDANP